jgi:hypothetical protein
MKRDLLEESHRLQLIKQLQVSTGLPLPSEDLYLGNINFLLYEKESAPPDNSHVLQIQWGSKSIFIDKHFVLKKNQELIQAIVDFFDTNCLELRAELIKYTVDQLNDIVAVELPVKITEKLPALTNYRVFVDITKKHGKEYTDNQTCWPQISVFIAWEEEFGEFEEFVFPLPFNAETNHFLLNYEEIVSAFIKYRNVL